EVRWPTRRRTSGRSVLWSSLTEAASRCRDWQPPGPHDLAHLPHRCLGMISVNEDGPTWRRTRTAAGATTPASGSSLENDLDVLSYRAAVVRGVGERGPLGPHEHKEQRWPSTSSTSTSSG